MSQHAAKPALDLLMTPADLSQIANECLSGTGVTFSLHQTPAVPAIQIHFRGECLGVLTAVRPCSEDELRGYARLVEGRIAEEYRLRVIAEGASRLAAARSRREIAEELAASLEKLIHGANGRAVYFPSEDGKFRILASHGLDPGIAATAHCAGEGHVGWCAERKAQHLLVFDYWDQAEQSSLPVLNWQGPAEKPRSILTVPTPGPGPVADLVVQFYADEPQRFRFSDIAPVRTLGSLAAACDRRIGPQGRDTGERWDLISGSPNGGADLTERRLRLYDRLCDQALRVSGGVRSAIRIYDAGRNELRFIASAGNGWTKTILDLPYPLDGSSTAARSAQLASEVKIEDPDSAEHYKKIFPDVRSLVAIPLFVRREFIAILSVDSAQRNVFTPAILQELRNLAATAESILEHFALLEETWLRDLEHTCEFAAKNDNRNPEARIKTVCTKAVNGIQKLFGARACSVFLKERGADRIALIASTALKEGSYDFGVGLTGWVAKEQKPIRVRNVADPHELRTYYPGAKWRRHRSEYVLYADAVERKAQTFLAVPVLAGREILGVLRLTIKEATARETAPSFRHSDEKLAERFASRLALIIQNLEHERDLLSLAEFSKRLLSTQGLPEICALVLSEFCDITGCNVGHIRLWDEGEQILRLHSSYPADSASGLHPLRRLREGFSGIAAAQRQPVWVSDVQAQKDYRELLAASRKNLTVASAAAIPLILQERLVGTLTLHSTTLIRFDLERRALFEDLASRAALALQAAKSAEDLAKELKALQGVFTKTADAEKEFLRSRNLDALLRMLLVGALDVSGIAAGTIRLLRGKTWVLKAAWDKSEPEGQMDLADRLSLEVPLRHDDFFGHIHASTMPVVIEDTAAHTEFQRFIASVPKEHQILLRQVKSVVAVPIRFQDACVGLLFLLSKDAHRLGQLTVGYLDILASFTAVAIQNSKAFELDAPFTLLGRIMEGFLHRMRNVVQHLHLELQVAQRTTSRQVLSRKLTVMRHELRSLTQLFKDVQSFARVQHATSEKVDLRRIVEDAATYRLPATRHVTVTTTCPEKPVLVYANSVQLRQAIERLIENSFEAIGNAKRGEIGLVVATDGRDAVVRVSDDGPGMSEEMREKCFLPFVSSKPKGYGLGLAITHGLIRHNGGEIQVVSALKDGTTFIVRFPLAGGAYA